MTETPEQPEPTERPTTPDSESKPARRFPDLKLELGGLKIEANGAGLLVAAAAVGWLLWLYSKGFEL